MTAMSNVDPSTLGWVKTEIDNTLKQARLALESFAENTADSTRLRFFITHLHQVVGTLQMVELDGAALLAREIEALADAVLNNRIEPAEDMFDVLTRAILSLSEYLDQLLAGRPDVPLRLISLLNELRAAHHSDAYTEISLFAPDLSIYPPHDRARREDVSEEEYAALAGKLRGLYQTALLRWLRNVEDATAITDLADVLERLENLARFGSVAQLWWVARALVAALQSGGLEPTVEVRKLFGQVDQQLKKLVADGEAGLIREPADELVKAILYYIGRADSADPAVAMIQQEFDLAALLPKETGALAAAPLGGLPSQEALRSVTAALSGEIEVAQEMLSAYFDPEQPEADQLDDLIDLLHRMASTLETLGVHPLRELVTELEQTCKAVVQGEVADLDGASLQMAGSLLLIENSARELDKPGTDWQRQIDNTIGTLRELRGIAPAHKVAATAEGIEISEAALTESEFTQLLGVVAGEIRINLKRVEEALETFAADTARVEPLGPIPNYLNQIQGAVQILGQERAAELISITNHFVQDIMARQLAVDSTVLDALAVAVGTVEAYIDGLEHHRPNLGHLIDKALQDLDAAVGAKRIPGLDPVTLNRELKENFERWIEETENASKLHALKQSLRDIGALADVQGQDKIRKISAEMNNLLEIVADDLSFLSDDIIATLRKSFDTLLGLSSRNLHAAPAPAGDGTTSLEMPETLDLSGSGNAAQQSGDASEMLELPDVIDLSASERPLTDDAGLAALVEPEPEAANDMGADPEVLEIFLEEAQEVVQLLSELIPKWAARQEDHVTLAEIRRGFHTLKGSGRLAGTLDLAELAWTVEHLLNQVLDAKLTSSAEMVDFVRRVRDFLQALVTAYVKGEPLTFDLGPWQAEAAALAEGEPPPEPEPERGAETQATAPETDTSAQGESADDLAQPAPGPQTAIDPVVLEIFTREVRGHLAAVEAELAACEANPERCGVFSELLRSAHTLQGTSRSLGLKPMAVTCEHLEEMLDRLAGRARVLESGAIALVREVTALIEELLEALNAGGGLTPELEQRFSDLSAALVRRAGGAEHADHEPWYVKENLDAEAPPAEAEPSVDPALLEVFREEAVDLLAQIFDALRRWRADPSDPEVLESLQRSLHTLKGSARMAGAETIGELSHNTESLLKKLETDGSPPPLALLEEVHDNLASMVEGMRADTVLPDVSELNARVLEALENPVPAASSEAPAAEPEADTAAEPDAETPAESPQTESADRAEPDAEPQPRPVERRHADRAKEAENRRGAVRVNANLLDNLSNYAGEVSITRARLQQQVFDFKDNLKELRGNVTRFQDQVRELEIQADSQIMARSEDAVSSVVGQDFDPLEFDRYSRLQQLSRGLTESLNDLVTIQSGLDNFVGVVETTLQQQARLNTDLQEGLMRTRMVGFAAQIPRLRHILRQTARELGKQAELHVNGADVELDRKLLERMLGPLEHMVRNAVTHGIETEDVRRSAGKPEVGNVTLELRNEGGEIVLRLSDDGAGLDLARIRARAEERGLIQPNSRLPDAELGALIMTPGFSTAEQVTQLSGRGVGMDVVYSEVKQLGGTVGLENRPGKGMAITIHLPLTLSIMQALIVMAGDQPFAIPVPAIVNIVKLDSDQVGNGADTLSYRDHDYPFMRLSERLGVPATGALNGNKVPILMVRTGDQETALQVDALVNRQEIVVKTLGPQIAELPGVAGATILGDGRVVLILDVNELWMTKKVPGSIVYHAEPPAETEPTPHQPVVMVVDDSLTVRRVTDRSLHKHGMEVVLAKDGVEALEMLRSVKPDVMLVDIEMPRMDGFELTTRVRDDIGTRDIPIIIITSRAGKKHKEKAMELGANLYLTKPYLEEDLVANIESVLARPATRPE